MAKPRELNAEEQAALVKVAAMPDDEIDTTDVPEVRDWSRAQRGALYRPLKKQLTLRLDADVLEWFRAHASVGEGYQTAINKALREYVEAHGQKQR
jgi:uncharacterized protein (DUF4415 family)